MRFLADENVEQPIVGALREAGYDVICVSDVAPGAADKDVLELANVESRLLLTNDKDFGELAFRQRLPAECGIILFRLSGSDPDADARRILDVLASRDDWGGHFAVASDDRVRIRPLAVPPSTMAP